MAQITLRLDDDLLDDLENEADERGVSRSAHIRDAIESRHEPDELRRENDRLRARVDAVLESRDERDALVRYVEDEQRYRQAGIVTRLRWFLRGMNGD